MRTVQNYLDLAIERNNLQSDNHIGRKIGITSSAINSIRKGKSLPSDDTMIKIAELAFIDKQIALLDLGYWRTTGATQMVYKELMSKLAGVLSIAIIIMGVSSGSVQAADLQENKSPLLSQKDTLSHKNNKPLIMDKYTLSHNYTMKLVEVRRTPI